MTMRIQGLHDVRFKAVVEKKRPGASHKVSYPPAGVYSNWPPSTSLSCSEPKSIIFSKSFRQNHFFYYTRSGWLKSLGGFLINVAQMDVYHGNSYSNGWLGGTSILGNLKSSRYYFGHDHLGWFVQFRTLITRMIEIIFSQRIYHDVSLYIYIYTRIIIHIYIYTHITIYIYIYICT